VCVRASGKGGEARRKKTKKKEEGGKMMVDLFFDKWRWSVVVDGTDEFELSKFPSLVPAVSLSNTGVLFDICVLGALASCLHRWSPRVGVAWWLAALLEVWALWKSCFLSVAFLDFIPRVFVQVALVSAWVAVDDHVVRARGLTALCYSLYYFGVVYDNYQHHYLLALVAWVLVAWHTQYHWHAHLTLRMQLAIVYMYAVWTKVLDDGLFLHGDVLRYSMKKIEVYEAVHVVAADICGVEDETVWQALAWATVLAECVLVLLFSWGSSRALWSAVVLVVFLHGGIEVFGNLRIGYFSYYLFVLGFLLALDKPSSSPRAGKRGIK
jgi:hypothetical protein